MAVDAPQSWFEGTGKVRLFQQSWVPGTARAVLVVVHGLKDHSSRYADFARLAVARGFAVEAFDLRGHGRSEGPREFVKSFQEYLDDLGAFLTLVNRQHPGTPTLLFGHSMGGAIVAEFTLLRAPHVAGLALSAPGLRPPKTVSALQTAGARLASVLTPHAKVLKVANRDFSRDPVVVSQMDSDPLITQGAVPARTAAEFLGAMKTIRAHRSGLSTPFLVQHGTGDKLTNPEGSQEFFQSGGPSDKTLKLYPGLYHDLLHEPERATVMQDLLGWLEAHVPKP